MAIQHYKRGVDWSKVKEPVADPEKIKVLSDMALCEWARERYSDPYRAEVNARDTSNMVRGKIIDIAKKGGADVQAVRDSMAKSLRKIRSGQ